MKLTGIIVILLLFAITVSFSQPSGSGSTNLQSALNELKEMVKTFFGVGAMLLCIVSIIPLAIFAFAYFIKLHGSFKNVGFWKNVAVISGVLAACCVIGFGLAVALYILTPVIISALVR